MYLAFIIKVIILFLFIFFKRNYYVTKLLKELYHHYTYLLSVLVNPLYNFYRGVILQVRICNYKLPKGLLKYVVRAGYI